MKNARALLVALLAPLPYLASLRGQFLDWDDDRFIAQNPLFAGPLRAYVAAAFTRIQFEAYHPLHLLSYVPDRLLWPQQPAGFHALTLALFALTAALLYGLIRRLIANEWAAVAATLLFAWHPLVVEPVAWISDRKDVLALLLVIGVLHCEDRRDDRRAFGWLSALLTALAFLTKTSTVVLPLLIFGWHRWLRQRSIATSLRRSAASAAVAVGLGVFVVLLWGRHQMTSPARPLSLPLDVLGTLATYARRVLVPVNLSPIYEPVAGYQALAGIVLAAATLLVAVAWRRVGPAARFALLMFFGALLPVSNLFPVYYRFADRYVLLALFALVPPLAIGLERLFAHSPRARGIAMAAIAVVLLAEAAATARQTAVWHDSLSLWSHAARVQPRAAFAQLKLGGAQRRAGQWREATTSYLRAIDIEPRSLLGFAGLFVATGERAEAEGRLAKGTTEAWIQRLGSGRPAETERLLADVAASGCRSCAHALTWMFLRMNPRSDDELHALARRAIEGGDAALALVFLGEARDQRSPEQRQLQQQARAGMKVPQ